MSVGLIGICTIQTYLTHYVRPKLAKQEAKLVTSSLVFLIIPLSNTRGPEPLVLNKLSFETKIGLG